jgi:ubiquinone/menaquinone biosynthesis C-methylase UbiE
MDQEVRQYWEDRAGACARTATTDDVHLRELEAATVVRWMKALPLPEHPTVLDAGCGDGQSTLRVAEAVPTAEFLGVDFAENMIAAAQKRLQEKPAWKERVSFTVGDVLDLDPACRGGRFEVVFTMRCLINLRSRELQRRGLSEIADRLKPGGVYLAIENFLEGHDAMNAARRTVELPEIPVRWHNRFFVEPEFREDAGEFFEDIRFDDFCSSYYFATRVIYSALCKMRGEEPDYDHDIHRLAVHLPSFGQLSPIRLAILRKRT